VWGRIEEWLWFDVGYGESGVRRWVVIGVVGWVRGCERVWVWVRGWSGYGERVWVWVRVWKKVREVCGE